MMDDVFTKSCRRFIEPTNGNRASPVHRESTVAVDDIPSPLGAELGRWTGRTGANHGEIRDSRLVPGGWLVECWSNDR